jgi:uncharacterized protein (TIGR00369 family)
MTASADHSGVNDSWLHPWGADAEQWIGWANNLPLCRDLGMRCVEFDEASAVFVMERPALTPNPNGAVNGGIVAAAADQVMGAVTLRMSRKGMLPATGSLHIQYHRPALAPITFRAASLGGGNRTKFVEVIVEDRFGTRCATSQGTMIAGGSKAKLPQAG